jgi:adenine-specific DNA-methyltransferase
MVNQLEVARQTVQIELDARKSQAERNRLGQFATPAPLALDVLKACEAFLPKRAQVSFLDPAIGTGSFYSALLHTFPTSRITSAVGYEIDSHYGDECARLWAGTPLELYHADFTRAKPPANDKRPNLIVCNPPYVRHHHLKGDEKRRLQRLTASVSGMQLSGLSGLYCHFVGLSHAWLADDGLAAWLIPSEFMDVNYGQVVKEYLLSEVTLHRVHRFDPNELQFADALVSSAVLLFTKQRPPAHHEVQFSYGGSLQQPTVVKAITAVRLRHETKWTRHPLEDVSERTAARLKLADLFTIKRGLASGANEFFILTEEQAVAHEIPSAFLTPILPSPRHVAGELVDADASGLPRVKPRLFLFGSSLDEGRIRTGFPAVWKYLERGRTINAHAAYLCQHRKPWYAQEDRPAAPIVCTYISRQVGGRPFRFIRNRSRATASNVYLMLYPKPQLAKLASDDPTLLDRVCDAMNQIDGQTLRREGRVYGGGLHKLEPKELANAPADLILSAAPKIEAAFVPPDLFSDFTDKR